MNIKDLSLVTYQVVPLLVRLPYLSSILEGSEMNLYIVTYLKLKSEFNHRVAVTDLVKSFLCLHTVKYFLLLKAYDNVESSMRKASVFCIVSLHQLAGEDLQPHLESLTGSKLKLLNLYIKRAQERTQFNRKYCCFVTFRL